MSHGYEWMLPPKLVMPGNSGARVVHKFQLQLGRNLIELPETATILSLGVQQYMQSGGYHANDGSGGGPGASRSSGGPGYNTQVGPAGPTNNAVFSGTQFVMWAALDQTIMKRLRRFLLCGTGWPIEEMNPMVHVQTVQHQAYVWHLFEVLGDR